MTRLLVSVRSASEARAALSGGADIIDVKEPLRGSLGRADEPVWQEVVAAARDRAPVSVALGELQDGEVAVAGLAGVSFAKIGLAGCQSDPNWREQLRQVWQSLPPSVEPVAVMYADWQAAEAPLPEAILELAAECRVRHILIDTYVKSAGRLLDHWPLAELGRFSAQVADLDQKLVLAGSLDAASIAQVLPLHPWAIAVRGAVCGKGREGRLSHEAVKQLKERFIPA
jgi:uncharacterized protein (UPF0264 family)